MFLFSLRGKKKSVCVIFVCSFTVEHEECNISINNEGCVNGNVDLCVFDHLVVNTVYMKFKQKQGLHCETLLEFMGCHRASNQSVNVLCERQT